PPAAWRRSAKTRPGRSRAWSMPTRCSSARLAPLTAPETPRSEASASRRASSPIGPAKPTRAPVTRSTVASSASATAAPPGAAARGGELRLGERVIAADERHHGRAVVELVDERLDEALGRLAEEGAHLLDRALAGGRDPLERALLPGRRWGKRSHLGLLDVGRVAAAVAGDDRVLARLAA